MHDSLHIASRRVLFSDGNLRPAELTVRHGRIESVTPLSGRHGAGTRDLLLLPGIVDLHGDAFERQIMPRPGVSFGIDVALTDTDRQLVANGITTAFHAVTYSWEPGLRGRDTLCALMDALERLGSRLACDTRLHLRYETFNLEAEAEVAAWIRARRIALLAFNDHTPAMVEKADDPKVLAKLGCAPGPKAISKPSRPPRCKAWSFRAARSRRSRRMPSSCVLTPSKQSSCVAGMTVPRSRDALRGRSAHMPICSAASRGRIPDRSCRRVIAALASGFGAKLSAARRR